MPENIPEKVPEKAPDNPYSLFSDLLKLFPKWLQKILFLLALAGTGFILFKIYWPSEKQQVEKGSFYTIQGTAILKKDGRKTVLTQYTISLGNASPLQRSETDMNGNFYIENVELPADKAVIYLKATLDGVLKYSTHEDIKALLQPGKSHDLILGDVEFREDNTPPPPAKTFGINIPHKGLRNLIQSHTGLLYAYNSTLRIEVKQTNEIKKLDNGLYYYPGGTLEFRIPATGCHANLGFPIEGTFHAGNDSSYVSDRIQEKINEIVKNNTSVIAQKIAKCFE
ncbi:hypothetical protein [Chitinophaga niabensis]|uniref:Uncharacterized protein n=1 Tax=Chitinophaga niabensis TaxID=536979 RepID=A0A1N6E8X7_9BACT|nr:hypothetical protein [Chitinophaga niabensis]SIN79462.1 hypothetical protein SAMN04488055_1395 [Chitinophaga niabensis]